MAQVRLSARTLALSGFVIVIFSDSLLLSIYIKVFFSKPEVLLTKHRSDCAFYVLRTFFETRTRFFYAYIFRKQAAHASASLVPSHYCRAVSARIFASLPFILRF